MPHGTVTVDVPAPSSAVFQLLHDYDRRLEWDTLLRDARLCPGFSQAQLHATSVCTGRWFLGGIALKTDEMSRRFRARPHGMVDSSASPL